MSLPASHAGIAQCKADPAAAPFDAERDHEVRQLLDAAVRPDLHATGPLPDAVRPGFERSFGMDLSSVRVHSNSNEAAALGAHGFARGADIHLAPGRDGDAHLLAHEVAHIAQQAEGRVSATLQAKGAAVNDSPDLEAEADRMADDALAGRVVRRGPELQPTATGVAQGYFMFGVKQVDQHSREVQAVRAVLVKRGDDVTAFDKAAAAPTNQGKLTDWAPVSVKRCLDEFGTTSPPTKKKAVALPSDSESSSSESSSSESDDDRPAMLGRYSSQDLPEASSDEGEETLRNKGDKTEATLKLVSPHSGGAHMAHAIRDFREQKGRAKADPTKHYPVITKMGSSFWEMKPNPHRKDGAVGPLVRTESGEALEREGNVKPYAAAAKALDGHKKRLALTDAQMNRCIETLRQNADATIGDMPDKIVIDAECMAALRELVMILLCDESRASRAEEVIEKEALGKGTFSDRFSGAKPSYRGAPTGGSKALQEYTKKKKEEEKTKKEKKEKKKKGSNSSESDESESSSS